MQVVPSAPLSSRLSSAGRIRKVCELCPSRSPLCSWNSPLSPCGSSKAWVPCGRVSQPWGICLPAALLLPWISRSTVLFPWMFCPRKSCLSAYLAGSRASISFSSYTCNPFTCKPLVLPTRAKPPSPLCWTTGVSQETRILPHVLIPSVHTTTRPMFVNTSGSRSYPHGFSTYLG